MWFLVVAVAVLFGLALLVGGGLGLLVRPTNGYRLRLGTYYVLLAVSLLPFYLHREVVTTGTRGWYDTIEEHHGAEAVDALRAWLQQYRTVTLVGIAVLWGVGALLAWRVPLLSACLPAVGFVWYFSGPLISSASTNVPDFRLDNKPNLWLFILCGASTVLLLSYAWTGMRRPTSPLRAAEAERGDPEHGGDAAA